MKRVIESGFFNAYRDEATGKYDREYSSDQFRELFSLFFTNGIFAKYGDEFAVVADGTMEVKVSSGFAFIDGAWLKNPDPNIETDVEEVKFTIPNNATTETRVDGIFLQSSLLDRNCSIVYREADIIPINNGPTKELLIYTITVPSDASSITQSSVTDMRPTDQCGFVGGAVQQLSVSELYAQFAQQFTEWMEAEQADFDTWFESIKGQLSEDAAGNLLLQVEDLKTETGDLSTGLNNISNRVEEMFDIELSDVEPTVVEEGKIVMVYEEM